MTPSERAGPNSMRRVFFIFARGPGLLVMLLAMHFSVRTVVGSDAALSQLELVSPDVLTRAAADQKLIIVRLPLPENCSDCQRIEDHTRRILEHPAVARRADGFLFASPAELPTHIRNALMLERRRFKDPWRVYDPAGNLLFKWGMPADGAGLAALLQIARQASEYFIRSAALQKEGRMADALMARGVGYLKAAEPIMARNLFEKVRHEAARVGPAALADLAAVQIGWTWAAEGNNRHALQILEPLAGGSADPGARAAAWLAVGNIARKAQDEARARAAFEKAYSIASESAMKTAALRALEDLGGSVERGRNADGGDVIRLLAPRQDTFSGRVRFRVQILDPDVRRVAFFVNDSKVADTDRPPFSATLDLGALPHRQEIRAQGLNPEGRELGSDVMVVNGQADRFWIRLVQPQGDRLSGRTVVESAVHVPLQSRLKRIDIQWSGETKAVLDREPFRTTIDFPAKGASGILRVEAVLEDGATAEDVRLMNGTGLGEYVQVRVVEVLVSVEGTGRRRLTDLTGENFRVLEDGHPQQIESSRKADDVSVTMGLLLDSSESMQKELVEVQEAAAGFLEIAMGSKDRAFVVDFDSRPKLRTRLTGDLKLLTSGILNVHSGGGTALYDAIMFGLLQLQEPVGAKVLVVLTDGDDGMSLYSAKECTELAKRTGARIYPLILDRHKLPGTGPIYGVPGIRPARPYEELESLAEASGGRLFELRSVADLERVYRVIADELKSSYVIAYRSASDKAEGQWRAIEIRVDRPGAKVRTVSGYFPN